MAVFVALGKITDEGMKNLEAMGARHKRALERAGERGGKILGSYALLGQYDYLVILEAPDVKTAMYILIREAHGGNVKYETLAAIPMTEFADLIQD